METPSSRGEVIIKINSSDKNGKNNTNNDHSIKREESSFREFSFRKPDNFKNERVGGNDPMKILGNFFEQQKEAGEMSFDMVPEEVRQQQLLQMAEHNIRREVLQGLPPLPPDIMSRQSLSRNPSGIPSLDSANPFRKNMAQMMTNVNNNHGNANDGSREVRVSFQDSNPELTRRQSSIYSTVEVDDSASSSASWNGDDDEEWSRTGLHTRRSGSIFKSNSNDINNKYNSGEVLRCTSSVSSRNMASRVSISKTKSRLMDPPSTLSGQRSGVLPKSGPINTKSGLLGKFGSPEEDEDDPFLGDDLPEEFKKGKVSVLVILEWLSLILLVGALICSLIIPAWKKQSLWHMKLWKWDVLVLVVICGRLVSGWGIKVIVFFIERNFLLRKRVLYFVYGLRKAVQNVIWLGLVMLTWHFMFDKNVKEKNSEPLKVVTKLLIIGEVGAVLWLLKTLLVKVCASTFHVNAFFDRIQESLFNQFVIETLSGPPFFELRQTHEDNEKTLAEVRVLQNAGINFHPDIRASVLARTRSGSVQTNYSGNIVGGVNTRSSITQSGLLSGPISKKQDEGISIDDLHKMNQNNVSAWNMKRLMKIVRHGFLTTLDERIIDATHQDDESSSQIRSEVEAKAAAKKMFRNVARPRSKFIYLNDLLRFMREDEVVKTMSLFEGAAESERISKSALKNWVVNAFRERRALALTLSDTKTAVNKLHQIVNVIVSIIIIIMGVIILNIIPSKSLLFLSSQIVVVAFVFGNTCKNVFESIIFLFVIHPFDVGDRCEIDGIQMVVEEMNILTTVFLRYDNQKIIFPNYILLTKPIHNLYRSPDMGDAVEFCVHIATPPDKITLMRQRIFNYIESKKEHWYPDPLIVLKDIENLNLLRMAIWLQHRMNHQDMGERWLRRAILVEECVKIFRELDIEYRVYPMNVNITSMPCLSYANVSSPNRNSPSVEVVHP